ncbi:hypothetical protein D6851_17060 [Altericroceibacterium spongiae]|uniref:CinA C-terminal domain-containing protein n=1 Tax=Altericroceibacterium spongiae TaxID=2320269 RepID=A0A420E947_9SPHN|nr:hypothetical protein D6851_17060 [Altericroceibacterium spongiae]
MAKAPKVTKTDFGRVISNKARTLVRAVLERADSDGLLIATTESLPGGHSSHRHPGLSHCFECGFVVYSDQAKIGLLGIPREVIERHGAVSRRQPAKWRNAPLRAVTRILRYR